MSLTFLGIYREPDYSPGRHTSNDALILRLVGQALERLDIHAKLVSLEEARAIRSQYPLLFSMCQGPKAVAELTEWQKEGVFILNNPQASRNTYRDTLCTILRENQLPFPQSVMLSTALGANVSDGTSLLRQGAAWVKRGDVHAMQAGDVVRIERVEELPGALESFRTRHIPSVVLQEHRPGDEVKFYGVRGTAFFWPYYPKDSYGHPFDEESLRTMAEKAAEAMGVTVYGGDAIISPEGDITLIDLNDWPSFAPCRGAAAHAIAQMLKETYYANEHTLKTRSLSR